MGDGSWRRRHSIYLLWAFPLLGFVGLLYTGIRARRWNWLAWGLLYALLVIGVTAVAPEDENSVAYSAIGLLLLAVWIASAAQLFAYRAAWLRWKAHRQAGPTPVTSATQPPPDHVRRATWAQPAPPPEQPVGPTIGQASWADVPPPPPTAAPLPPYPPPPPPGTGPARGSRRRRIVIIAGVSVVVAIALFAILSDVIFTNDLLEADFAKGIEPFVTGETPDYVLDLDEGTYRIRSRTGAQSAAQSFAPFTRRAYAVDMSAEVASVSGDSVFGVACWHNRAGEGYALVAHPENGVALVRREGRDGPMTGAVLEANEDVPVPTADLNLRLSCGNSPVGSSVDLTGYLNGKPVIEAEDPDGYDGFSAGALMFQSETAGAEIRFRRAQAIVTGSDE
jgi:hypothetical protein